ncbi:MAG: hypothetical protein IKB93_02285 [Clostridia bacterium]|nr:hypothetical protein [Clostridia bacterium]
MMKNNISISVDLKKYRLRIHRNTLNALSVPKYVQLMINPEEMSLAICGTDKALAESHKVSLSQLNAEISYELYSKKLMTELCAIVPNLDKGKSYRLYGRKIAGEKVALFPMTSIQAIEKSKEDKIVR